jgi:hypothetical protein
MRNYLPHDSGLLVGRMAGKCLLRVEADKKAGFKSCDVKTVPTSFPALVVAKTTASPLPP